eukprot:8111817-Alexandrium_andersonii.AAC.1
MGGWLSEKLSGPTEQPRNDCNSRLDSGGFRRSRNREREVNERCDVWPRGPARNIATCRPRHTRASA